MDASSAAPNNYKTMGGVQFRTWFYGSNKDDVIRYHEHAASGLSGPGIAKFTSREAAAVKFEREKVVARPENVFFFYFLRNYARKTDAGRQPAHGYVFSSLSKSFRIKELIQKLLRRASRTALLLAVMSCDMHDRKKA